MKPGPLARPAELRTAGHLLPPGGAGNVGPSDTHRRTTRATRRRGWHLCLRACAGRTSSHGTCRRRADYFAIPRAPCFDLGERGLRERPGQNLGSLFEAGFPGRAFLGAGFVGVYNTLFRTDRHTLQFFRPGEGGDQFSIEPLPRPSEDAGAFLFDLDGALYAWGYVHDLAVRRWQGDRWEVDASFDRERIRLGDVRMRVGKGLLELAQSTIRYEGKVVVPPPEEGAYHHLYYANGHLVFYHTGLSAAGSGCALDARDEAAADLARASVLTSSMPGRPRSRSGNWAGGAHLLEPRGPACAFDGTEWRILREPDDRVSYQIYSMLNYYDRLLMAHYPSGTLYNATAARYVPEGWPRCRRACRPACARPRSQPSTGELFVGCVALGRVVALRP